MSVAFFTFKSDINGKSGYTTTGCKGCHGANAVTTTTMNLTGAPANGYVPGTVYTLTLAVNSSNAAMTGAGFGLKAMAGTIANITGQGTTIKSGELVHSARKSFTSGAATWDFKWTAPASGAVTVNVVGNAVNGNGQDDTGDQWNLATYTIAQAVPQAISNAVINQLNISPNPCTTQLQIGNASKLSNVKVVTLNGSFCNVNIITTQNTIDINTENLVAGLYIIIATENNVRHFTKFVKN